MMKILKSKKARKVVKPVVKEKKQIEAINNNETEVEEQEKIETSLQSLEIAVKSDAESIGSSDEDLNWVQERPSPHGFHMVDQIRDEFKPLVCPMHLRQFTSSKPISFETPVDYFISWSDSHDCCGFVKNEEDATSQVPLVMRFGGFWTDRAVKSMYIGCTVRVKAYYQVSTMGAGREFMAIVPKERAPSEHALFAGIPYPSAFACEWAVVHRPQIHRSLGMLTKDLSYENQKGLLMSAIVKDFEYNDSFIACTEKWPIPHVKRVPAVGSPVIINYVEISEPHIVFECKDKRLPMPAHMVTEFTSKGVKEKDFIFGWLDLTMEPCRIFD